MSERLVPWAIAATVPIEQGQITIPAVFAEPASGSAKTAGMVICPCSMGTVAAIAHGTSRSLIERAADVVLKERRTLILVPRATPLSLVHLRNLTLATEAGAVGWPAATRVYHKPQQVR